MQQKAGIVIIQFDLRNVTMVLMFWYTLSSE
jgi:hypothetical protein